MTQIAQGSMYLYAIFLGFTRVLVLDSRVLGPKYGLCRVHLAKRTSPRHLLQRRRLRTLRSTKRRRWRTLRRMRRWGSLTVTLGLRI